MFARSFRVGSNPSVSTFGRRACRVTFEQKALAFSRPVLTVGPASVARFAPLVTVASSRSIANSVWNSISTSRIPSHSSSKQNGGGCCNSSSTRAYASASADNDAGALKGKWPWERPPPDRLIVELLAPAELREAPQGDSDVSTELPRGELVEAFGDIDKEWLLVRAPIEDNPDLMSDKPLAYQDGWLRNADMKLAVHQLGDPVAAVMTPEAHTFFDVLKLWPAWRDSAPDAGDAPLPKWITRGVSELHTGKIFGVATDSRFVVQRPSGAVPERIPVQDEKILVPRQRWRWMIISGFVGFVISSIVGLALHIRAWLGGESVNTGRMAWPQLFGWISIVAVLVTPLTVGPCYLFTNSQGATVAIVTWVNLLLYVDLFGE